MRAAGVFVCMALCLAIGFFAGFLTEKEHKEEKATVGSDEVSDLIRRLKPYAKERWHMHGLSIEFYGDESVDIDLEFPNGTRIKSSGADLKGAVRTLTVPSEDVKNALVGWEK